MEKWLQPGKDAEPVDARQLREPATSGSPGLPAPLPLRRQANKAQHSRRFNYKTSHREEETEQPCSFPAHREFCRGGKGERRGKRSSRIGAGAAFPIPSPAQTTRTSSCNTLSGANENMIMPV